MKALFTKPGTGTGALISFLVMGNIAAILSEKWHSPGRYVVMAVMAACYLWKFAVLPFTTGLREGLPDAERIR